MKTPDSAKAPEELDISHLAYFVLTSQKDKIRSFINECIYKGDFKTIKNICELGRFRDLLPFAYHAKVFLIIAQHAIFTRLHLHAQRFYWRRIESPDMLDENRHGIVFHLTAQDSEKTKKQLWKLFDKSSQKILYKSTYKLATPDNNFIALIRLKTRNIVISSISLDWLSNPLLNSLIDSLQLPKYKHTYCVSRIWESISPAQSDTMEEKMRLLYQASLIQGPLVISAALLLLLTLPLSSLSIAYAIEEHFTTSPVLMKLIEVICHSIIGVKDSSSFSSKEGQYLALKEATARLRKHAKKLTIPHSEETRRILEGATGALTRTFTTILYNHELDSHEFCAILFYMVYASDQLEHCFAMLKKSIPETIKNISADYSAAVVNYQKSVKDLNYSSAGDVVTMFENLKALADTTRERTPPSTPCYHP